MKYIGNILVRKVLNLSIKLNQFLESNMMLFIWYCIGTNLYMFKCRYTSIDIQSNVPPSMYTIITLF